MGFVGSFLGSYIYWVDWGQCFHKRIIKSLYFALFHSHINYGLLAWGHASRSSDVLLLQLVIIFFQKPIDTARPLFKELSVLTVYSQYIYNGLLAVHVNRDSFTGQKSASKYATRSLGNLPVRFSRYSSSTNAFPIRHLKMYNDLPPDLKTLPAAAFRRSLKRILVDNPLYSLREWFLLDRRIFSLLDGVNDNNTDDDSRWRCLSGFLLVND